MDSSVEGVDEGKEKTDTLGSQGKEEGRKGKKTVDPPATNYNIEFTFDTDVRCAITIYYFATEEISSGQAVYVFVYIFLFIVFIYVFLFIFYIYIFT